MLELHDYASKFYYVQSKLIKTDIKNLGTSSVAVFYVELCPLRKYGRINYGNINKIERILL